MKLRALVFDDSEGIRELLCCVLDQRGYEVFTFPSPDLCPLHQETHCPCPAGCTCAHVIISDLRMPVIQGLDFVEELSRKECRCPSFALMSGHWSEQDLERANRLGCQSLAKPFSMDVLKTWLDRVESRVTSANQPLADRHLLSSDSA